MPNRNDEGYSDPLFPPISIFHQNGRGSKKRGKRGFIDMEIVQHLQLVKKVALGPKSQVLTVNKYCVNGFKFHSEEVSRNKKTNNSGVYIQGDVDGTGQTIEYYGVIQEIIEVRHKDGPSINIIEVKHTRKYRSYDPFIIAQNAKQVYEASYPLLRDKADWWVVIKSKPVGIIEIDNVLDVAYQNDVAIVQQEVDVELETTLQHPQHILEVSDDDILMLRNKYPRMRKINHFMTKNRTIMKMKQMRRTNVRMMELKQVRRNSVE
ncbi:hypothetical protein RDI58_010704 [Solanum bulbocastanum]|uniref:DUF4216 domain-containing protein n=1 Tax=Solanum bulbocastanum TaxID=147425 RepID=A0AAN8YJR6_SOLBU